MATYGTLNLEIKPGTLVISPASKREVVHYPGTNSSSVFDLGRPPTLIRCVLLAMSESEKNQILARGHSGSADTLALSGVQYKNVLMQVESITNIVQDKYEISVVFTALDPIPYDLAGVKLYG